MNVLERNREVLGGAAATSLLDSFKELFYIVPHFAASQVKLLRLKEQSKEHLKENSFF